MGAGRKRAAKDRHPACAAQSHPARAFARPDPCRRPAQPVHRLVFSVHARECALSRAVRCMLDDGTGSCARRLSGRERCGGPPACGSILAFLLRGAAVPFSVGLRRSAHTDRTVDDYCSRRGYSRQQAGAERRGAVRCACDACPVRQNGRDGRQGRGQHGCGDGARRCEFRPIHFSAR